MRIYGPDKHLQPLNIKKNSSREVDRTNPNPQVNRAESSAQHRKGGGLGETVVLSKRAADLAGKVAADDASREARIETIKQEIEEGRYIIDLKEIAERLVDEELERLNRGSS